MMRIQVGGLSDGVHKYHFEEKASEIGLGDGFQETVVVDATLEKTGHQYYLGTHIRTGGVFHCDRCVAEFTSVLSPSYHMLYVTEGTETSSFDPSELQIVPPGLNVIDITEDVRQVILLSVPLKLLCRDDCKGLCPHCGKDLNEGQCSCSDKEPDSRWDALRLLR